MQESTGVYRRFSTLLSQRLQASSVQRFLASFNDCWSEPSALAPQHSEICAIYRTLIFNNGTEAQEVNIQAVAYVGAWNIAYTGQIDWPVQLRRQHVRIG